MPGGLETWRKDVNSKITWGRTILEGDIAPKFYLNGTN